MNVAALDDPMKFNLRRNQIAEKLHTCQSSGCCCSDRIMDHQPHVEINKIKSECANKGGLDGNGDDDDFLEVLGDSRAAEQFEKHVEHYSGQIISFEQSSKYSMEETESLIDKIDEDHDTISHILEIKKRLENNENETETEIRDALRMLQIIVLSVEDLEVTRIGTTVSDLQHHWSTKIIQLAKMVTAYFKRMIEQRIDENVGFSERTKGHEPPTVLDEDALCVPQILTEGVPISTIPPEEFATYFEELDEHGYPRTSYEIEEIHERQRNPATEKKRKIALLLGKGLESIPSKKGQKLPRKESNEKFSNQRNSRPSDSEYSSRRFGKQRMQKDVHGDREMHKMKNKHAIHQRANAGLRHSRGSLDHEAAMEEKLETSKRKLHQGFQAHERARRNTQFVAEVNDIPKDEEYSRRSSRMGYINQRYWRW